MSCAEGQGLKRYRKVPSEISRVTQERCDTMEGNGDLKSQLSLRPFGVPPMLDMVGNRKNRASISGRAFRT